MADYLLVVDMQSDYVAAGKAYDNEALTAAVNDKIASYPSDRVIYILNRFFWERKDRKKKFATGLQVVSSRIFEKSRASCFTNSDLKEFLEGNGAKSIEFIGVDGNGCVKASVLAAVKENYQVSVDLSAVGVANQKKFQKTLHKWHSAGGDLERGLSSLRKKRPLSVKIVNTIRPSIWVAVLIVELGLLLLRK